LAERTIAEQAQQGISFFTAERGAGLMNWAIAQQVPVMVVAPINWQTYGVARAARNEPLLSELKPTIAAKDREGRASASLDVVEDIFATVRDAVARTLHFSIDEIDPNKEFGAMGLTSLLALELRNRLERALRRPLSATLAWNHPTVAGLAAYLSGADKPQPQPVRDEIRPEKNTEALAAEMTKMAELSDADALLALRRRRKDVRS
jgi:myxalamid-type polyketide synthase MxaE and MxaD